MADITASMVKALREKSGAGMMDCKAALTETGGDMEAAIDWLRTKGLATAAKKAGRVAAEGLVGVVTPAKSGGKSGAMVEVNSETDFVARNEKFQQLVGQITDLAADANGDIDTLLDMPYPGAGKSVRDHVTAMIATIGENMNVRRAAALSVEAGVVVSYVHSQIAPGLGKIGVLVGLESNGDAERLAELAKQIAMHVAATNPYAVTTDALDAAVIARERAVLTAEAKESGRPDNIIEKMVDGRMRKFFEEVVLLSQSFVVDSEKTVEQAIKAAEADIGAPVKVIGFVRFALGEGIEKEEADFAAEVAAAVRS